VGRSAFPYLAFTGRRAALALPGGLRSVPDRHRWGHAGAALAEERADHHAKSHRRAAGDRQRNGDACPYHPSDGDAGADATRDQGRFQPAGDGATTATAAHATTGDAHRDALPIANGDRNPFADRNSHRDIRPCGDRDRHGGWRVGAACV